MTAVVKPTVHKRRGPLLTVLVANVLSISGTTMTYLAIPWFVLETTGSAVRTGLVLGLEVAGVVVSSVLAGPIIDRLGYKRSSVLSDLLAAVAVVLVPVLYFSVGLPFGVLLVLTALLGFSRAPGETARSSMMPSLIELAGTSLNRAAGAYDGVNRAAKALGAPLAGVLVALTGAPAVLLIDAATFLVSALLLAFLVPSRGGEQAASRSYLRELVSGFAYLRHDRLMGAIVLMVMVTNALDTASMAVLLPVYARDVLHSSVALGLLGGGFSLGAAAGTALYTWFGHRLPNWATFTLVFILVGSPRYFLMAAEPGLAPILIVLVLSGVLGGAINPILGVVEYRRLPDDMRAKVLGVMSGGVLAVAPLGAVLGGFAVASFGLTTTLLLVGGAYLVATLCPLMFPTWREMDASCARSNKGCSKPS